MDNFGGHNEDDDTDDGDNSSSDDDDDDGSSSDEDEGAGGDGGGGGGEEEYDEGVIVFCGVFSMFYHCYFDCFLIQIILFSRSFFACFPSVFTRVCSVIFACFLIVFCGVFRMFSHCLGHLPKEGCECA